MTTDVHQQRMNRPRNSRSRRCDGCGVSLFDFESAWPDSSQPGGFKRVDRCIHCCVYGPPRRPQGSPPSSSIREVVGRGAP